MFQLNLINFCYQSLFLMTKFENPWTLILFNSCILRKFTNFSLKVTKNGFLISTNLGTFTFADDSDPQNLMSRKVNVCKS